MVVGLSQREPANSHGQSDTAEQPAVALVVRTDSRQRVTVEFGSMDVAVLLRMSNVGTGRIAAASRGGLLLEARF